MPFLDVVTNERDVSLPLTVPEWEEWGDPLHNSTDYQYMLTYSPIDNIRRCSLPLPPGRVSQEPMTSPRCSISALDVHSSGCHYNTSSLPELLPTLGPRHKAPACAMPCAHEGN